MTAKGKAAKKKPKSASPTPAAPKVPWPEISVRPRDGEYVERFPGTDRVHVRGTFAGGLKQGSWKRYWENGNPREDYSYDRGIAHGPELDWHANGERWCVGNNRHGKRTGEWTWYHDNGAFMYCESYDEAGMRRGEHRWDLEDGRKRARGQYEADKLHGHWTWWHEPSFERVERDYHHGVHHGVDEAWFPGGHLAYRRRFVHGRKEGLEEIYQQAPDPNNPAIVLAFHGEWRGGFPVGEHLSVEVTGKETRTSHVAGLLEKHMAPAVGEKALKKLRKATSSYAKADALGEGVEYSERAPHLLHLWREGRLDVAADPDLWELLSQVTVFLTGEEVVKLLRGVPEKAQAHGSFLSYWPDSLDRIVMEVHARDPAPIDAGAAGLSERMKKGVSFVQARFGRPTSVPLAEEMTALATKHVDEYGLGQRVLWPDEDGHVVEQTVFLDHRGTETPLFGRLLALFGTEEAWRKALAERVEAGIADKRLPFRLLRPLLAHASPEEMIRYLDAIALDGDTQDLIRAALTEWRKDDPETLVRIALGVTDTGLRKWPVVAEALIALAAAGKPAPQQLVDALPLANESPTYSTGWFSDPLRELSDEQKKNTALVFSKIPIAPGCAVPRMERLREALATLPKDMLARRLGQQIESEYGKTTGNQFLHLVDDPELWARAVQVTEKDSYGHVDASIYGLGDLGEKGIPLLLALQKRVKGKAWREAIAKALIVALARAVTDTGTFAPELDEHVSFGAIPKDYDYRFYEPFLQRIVHLLPAERAEPLLLEGLASPYFSRAFRMIGSHPSPPVLHAAFTELLAREATFKYEDQQAVGQGLGSLPDARTWVKWILRSGGGGGMRDALGNAVGHAAVEEIEEELASAGVEKAAEIDDIEKVRLRAEAEGGGKERIYLLRKLEAEGHGADLNRIGGAAPGVGAARWPKVRGEPMTHLFTLDLDTMPELRARVACEDGGTPRAVSVFCLNPDDNEAYQPDTDETAVVVSSEAQAAAPAELPDEVALMEPRRFEPVAVNVAPSVWRSRSSDLQSAIYGVSARALGEPIWLQSPEHSGELLCQFDDGFVSMNLGDTGVMYVFADTAFWQCH